MIGVVRMSGTEFVFNIRIIFRALVSVFDQ
ncbi:Uncharacterised protein [Vibrio cholerae]|nr:Uncharacterised protein [Vibrio cholerae]CSD17288.1 Uncharacterised protein [Vibrio cholerae]